MIGGPGKSGSPISRGLDNFANNDGWYDGVSDGPRKCFDRRVADKEPVLAEGGTWVVIAPPSYAPGIENVEPPGMTRRLTLMRGVLFLRIS